jgi:hypothetical protein
MFQHRHLTSVDVLYHMQMYTVDRGKGRQDVP